MEKTFAEKLIEALKHSDPRVRRDAAWLLGKKRAKEAVCELITAIEKNRSDPYLLSTIAESLGQISEPCALLPLANLLLSSYLPVRVKAAWALSQLGDPHAVTYLLAALDDPNLVVRQAVRHALEELENTGRK